MQSYTPPGKAKPAKSTKTEAQKIKVTHKALRDSGKTVPRGKY